VFKLLRGLLLVCVLLGAGVVLANDRIGVINTDSSHFDQITFVNQSGESQYMDFLRDSYTDDSKDQLISDVWVENNGTYTVTAYPGECMSFQVDARFSVDGDNNPDYWERGWTVDAGNSPYCIQPTVQPTATAQPTIIPTDLPPTTAVPTDIPIGSPTSQPTEIVTEQPTDVVTSEPTDFVTQQPTELATEQPTDQPPTVQPPKANECEIRESGSWVQADYTMWGNRVVSWNTVKGFYLITPFDSVVLPVGTFLSVEKNGYPFASLMVKYDDSKKAFYCVSTQIISEPTITATPSPTNPPIVATNVTPTIVPVGVVPTTVVVNTPVVRVQTTPVPVSSPVPTAMQTASFRINAKALGSPDVKPEKESPEFMIRPGYASSNIEASSPILGEIQIDFEGQQLLKYTYVTGVIGANTLQFHSNEGVSYGSSIGLHANSSDELQSLARGTIITVKSDGVVMKFIITNSYVTDTYDQGEKYVWNYTSLFTCRKDHDGFVVYSLSRYWDEDKSFWYGTN